MLSFISYLRPRIANLDLIPLYLDHCGRQDTLHTGHLHLQPNLVQVATGTSMLAISLSPSLASVVYDIFYNFSFASSCDTLYGFSYASSYAYFKDYS